MKSITRHNEIPILRVHTLVVTLATESEHKGLHRLWIERNIHCLIVSRKGQENHNIINWSDKIQEKREQILTLLQLQIKRDTKQYFKVKQHATTVLSTRTE